MADDLRAWGFDDEAQAAALAVAGDKSFEVEPENWAAVVLFLRVQTQWNVSGMGARTGLNYSGVRIVAELTGVELTADLFDRVQTLEIATINEWAKQHGKTASRSRNHR